MIERDQIKEATCIALYEAGGSMAEIGAVLGVSRERVRQIIERSGHSRSRRHTNTRADPLRIVAAFKATGDTKAAAKQCGISQGTVLKVLHALGFDCQRKRWTRESAVAALRALAAELVCTPRQQDVKTCSYAPSVNTVIAHFGSWTGGIDAAGLKRLPMGNPNLNSKGVPR